MKKIFKMVIFITMLAVLGGNGFSLMIKANNEIYLSNNNIETISILGESILTKLENQESVKIVCIGDSITAGTTLVTIGTYDYIITEENYPAVLEKLLKETFGYDDITVENLGVPGSTSDTLSEYYAELESEAADLVIIMFGINDYIQGVAIDDYYTNLVEASNYVQSLGAHCLLMSPTPIELQNYDLEAKGLLEYVNAASQAANVTGSLYIDMNKNVTNYLNGETLYSIMDDGIHFNEGKYKILSEYVLEYINSL